MKPSDHVPFIAKCPSCGRSGKIADKAAGRRVKCPGCKASFQAALQSESDAATLAEPTPMEDIPEVPAVFEVEVIEPPKPLVVIRQPPPEPIRVIRKPRRVEYEDEDDEDDSIDDDYERPGNFRCPFCRCTFPPRHFTVVNPLGWYFSIGLMVGVCTFPFFWVPLLVFRDPHVKCSGCFMRLS